MEHLYLTILAIGVCLTFTFVNGFHDGCNVVATIVSSGTMSPRKALILACLTELTAPLFLGTAVATTVGKGILDIDRLNSSPFEVSFTVIISALLGAILWNLFTWKVGLPSSSSHALIGGLIGAGLATYGVKMINWSNFFWKVVVVLFTTPLIGFFAGFLLIVIIKLLLKRFSRSSNGFFKFIQVFSMMFLASSHSTNDAQKSMGVIAMILFASGRTSEFIVPQWAIASSALAISIGLSLGGWSIVKTVGTKIFRPEPIHSFTSQLSSALVIITAGAMGGPVSTSQIVSSSIMGVGSGERMNAVNWASVDDIITSWIITIPSSALVAAAICFGLQLIIK